MLTQRPSLSLILCLLATPGIALASSSSALKRYESGKYDSALREYKRLLLEKPDDPRLHFNAGAAAFQANDFDEAQKQLNASLVTQDLQLQERAYYNLGNTEYRLGAEASDADKKQSAWEHSIADYTSALALNPRDEDATHNRDLVQKQLEELKKQREEQKKQEPKDDKKDQKEDQKNAQKDPPKKDDQSKQDQKQQDQQKQPQDQNKPDRPKPQPDQNQDKQKPEDDQAQPKPDASKDDKKPAESKQGSDAKENKPDNPEDEAQAQARQGGLARMTPKEAQRLLDAQKADEKAMIFIPKLKTNRADRVFKDW